MSTLESVELSVGVVGCTYLLKYTICQVTQKEGKPPKPDRYEYLPSIHFPGRTQVKAVAILPYYCLATHASHINKLETTH